MTDPTKPKPPTGAVLIGKPMTLAEIMADLPKKGAPPPVGEGPGASLEARLAVASLADNDHVGRLNAIRKYYPGAMMDEQGDYLYQSPTGEWQRMNGRGFQMADVLEKLPFLGEVAGGIAGGVAGATAGLPTFGLGTVPGAVLGSGAGAVAGRQLVTRGMQALTGTPDQRPAAEQGVDAAKMFAVNAVAEGGGRAVASGLKAGGRGIMNWARTTPDAAEVAITEAGKRLGAEVPKVINTRSTVLDWLTARLQNNPFTMQAFPDAAQKFLGAAEGAVAKIGKDIAGPNSVGITPFNNGLKAASADVITRFKATRNTLDDALQAVLPQGTRVPVRHSLNALATLEDEVAKSPALNWQLYGKPIEQLRKIASDAAGATRQVATEGLPGAVDAMGNPIMSASRTEVTRAPGVPFDVLRKIRTEVGEEAFWETPLARKTAEEKALGGVYDALKKDLGAAAESAGPEAADLWKLQNRYIQMSRSDARFANYDLFKQIAEYGGKDVSPAQWALKMETEGPEKIKAIFSRFTPSQRQALVGSIFEDMGSVERDGVRSWSMKRFAEQWDKMARVRDGIFDGPTFREIRGPLSDLVTLAKAGKEAEALATHKAGNLSAAVGSLAKWVALPSIGVVGGHPVLATLAGVSPLAAASLLTNPASVRLLAKAAKGTMSLASLSTRLAIIAKGDPALFDAVDELGQAGLPYGWPAPKADPSERHNTGKPGVQYKPIY